MTNTLTTTQNAALRSFIKTGRDGSTRKIQISTMMQDVINLQVKGARWSTLQKLVDAGLVEQCDEWITRETVGGNARTVTVQIWSITDAGIEYLECA